MQIIPQVIDNFEPACYTKLDYYYDFCGGDNEDFIKE